MSDKYENPIELDLVRLNGTYWALNDNDFDNCACTAAGYSHCQSAEVRRLSEEFEHIGTIRIPKVYFENESGPYVV